MDQKPSEHLDLTFRMALGLETNMWYDPANTSKFHKKMLKNASEFSFQSVDLALFLFHCVCKNIDKILRG